MTKKIDTENASKILDTLKLDQVLRLAKKKLKAHSTGEASLLYYAILKKFPNNKQAKEGLKLVQRELMAHLPVVQDPEKSQLDKLVSLYDQESFQRLCDEGKKLLQEFPESLFLNNICGASHNKLKQYELAQACYETAIKLDPKNPGTHQNMGVMSNDKGDYDTAISSFTKALALKPDFAEAYNNMGMALAAKELWFEATTSHIKALKINPGYAEAQFNIGLIEQKNLQYYSALESYEKALNIQPNFYKALFQMGTIHDFNKNRKAAMHCYNQVLKISPNHVKALTEFIRLNAAICQWAEIDKYNHLIPDLGTQKDAVSPFPFLMWEDAPLRHRLRAEKYAKTQFTSKSMMLPSIPKKKCERLRIGYFSADFHDFPGMYLMAGMIEQHDRTKFEIFAYSYGDEDNGPMRRRLEKAFDKFLDVKKMTDKDIALMAREDKIDIAIHRNGYTKNTRSNIFSFRAAPIQISYLGYPGTLGADCIDYLVADRVVIPNSQASAYSEKIIYLPNTYQPNDNTRHISQKVFTKVEEGLPEKGFIFCCFNNSSKISPVEFNIWMRLLSSAPESVLWIYKSNDEMEPNLRYEASVRGIDPERLIFAQPLPHAEHLARLRLADLFVDSFNCNAHTTASDALWAGLPLVTKIGEGFAARVAASLLTAIDLPELITDSKEGYETLILDLATNPKRLAKVKTKLIANRLTTPLFNTKIYTKHLETGYEQAYQRYIDGLEPNTIIVCN